MGPTTKDMAAASLVKRAVSIYTLGNDPTRHLYPDRCPGFHSGQSSSTMRAENFSKKCRAEVQKLFKELEPLIEIGANPESALESYQLDHLLLIACAFGGNSLFDKMRAAGIGSFNSSLKQGYRGPSIFGFYSHDTTLGSQALSFAVSDSNAPMVSTLIQIGANLNGADTYRKPIAFTAVEATSESVPYFTDYSGKCHLGLMGEVNLAILNQLLSSGLDIDVSFNPNRDKITLLEQAFRVCVSQTKVSKQLGVLQLKLLSILEELYVSLRVVPPEFYMTMGQHGETAIRFDSDIAGIRDNPLMAYASKAVMKKHSVLRIIGKLSEFHMGGEISCV